MQDIGCWMDFSPLHATGILYLAVSEFSARALSCQSYYPV